MEVNKRSSIIARLGSGSAARSVYGGFVSWGKQEGLEHTSDEFASPMSGNAGPAFTSLHDAILIISPDKKSISSSQGHAIMDEHPYAMARYRQARENIMNLPESLRAEKRLLFVLRLGDAVRV